MDKLKSVFTRDIELASFGLVTFLTALGIYIKTTAPTVSFWDCGEFIASSYILGVPHPPGAPFFLILGKFFSFLPFSADIGFRVNLISTISSALTILLLYLIIIQIARSFRGVPENMFDKLIVYGSASIGALTYAFSDTFWFNAVEAEVYALSMLFMSATLWLALKWFEERKEFNSIRNLLIIVYFFGLAYGVHLLNLLVAPTVLLLILLNNPKFLFKWELWMSAVAAAVVFTIFAAMIGEDNLLIVIGLSNLYMCFLLFLAAAIAAGLVLLHYKRYLLDDWKSLFQAIFIATFGILLIAVVGRSTYFLIYIRSGMDPIINENDPSTLSGLLYYLKREQYGSGSLLSSIFNRAAAFWDYQIKFMYLRYFGWNFIGKGVIFGSRGFIQESFTLNGLAGLPFIIGTVGFIYHWFKDWKKAALLFIFFIISGLMLVIYLNQPDPQPRERDYVYVGSFFAFAIWIGVGAMCILTAVKRWLENGAIQKTGTCLVAGVLLLICPVNQFLHNYDSHDRTGNYVAWDYSYNILMSCEPNAILFTNGDNDTFPLWYLQEVEGIRKDVRVVNLSLLNTDWYIHQLKYYEPRVPISLPDEQIKNVGYSPWEAQPWTLDVPLEAFESHFRDYGEPMPPSYQDIQSIDVQINPTLTAGGRTLLRTQDLLIMHIILNNQWRKPVYFAITIPTQSLLGFREYMRLDGLAWKVTPVKNPPVAPEILSHNLFNEFRYRGLNDPDVYLNWGTLRLLNNYLNGYIELSRYYVNSRQNERTLEVLERMSENVPDFRMSLEPLFVDMIGRMYYSAGRPEEFKSRILKMLEWKPEIPRDKQLEYAGMLYSLFKDPENAEKVYARLWKSDPNDNKALSSLISVLEITGQFEKAADNMDQWLRFHPNDSNAQKKLLQLRDSIKSK